LKLPPHNTIIPHFNVLVKAFPRGVEPLLRGSKPRVQSRTPREQGGFFLLRNSTKTQGCPKGTIGLLSSA